MIILGARLIGILLLVIGLVGILTPIPFGAIFIVVALLFLLPTTPVVARVLRWARRRHRPVDVFFDSVSRRTPIPYRRILDATRPRIEDRIYMD